jgi:hypothetical protein
MYVDHVFHTLLKEGINFVILLFFSGEKAAWVLKDLARHAEGENRKRTL